MENTGDVGGNEVLAIAYADDDGRAGAGGDDLVGFGGGEDAKSEGAGESLDGAANRVFEEDRSAGGGSFILNLLNEVGDDLCVSFGDKLVALGCEFALEVEVIFDNAVVDDDDATGAIAMRVSVLFRRAAVRRPAGVANAESSADGMIAQDFFEVAQLSRGAANFEESGVGAADGDTG
jgi:hypothetical protein